MVGLVSLSRLCWGLLYLVRVCWGLAVKSGSVGLCSVALSFVLSVEFGRVLISYVRAV